MYKRARRGLCMCQIKKDTSIFVRLYRTVKRRGMTSFFDLQFVGVLHVDHSHFKPRLVSVHIKNTHSSINGNRDIH